MSYLRIKGLHKSFGEGNKRVEVLKDINLEIHEGEFIAVLGFSGGGKTTLISLLAGLIRPDSGTITLSGDEITEPGPDRGIVFQNYSLLPWLTVEANIALAVDHVYSDWPEDRRRERVRRCIEMVHLTPARNKKPLELSGGMRQRVAVARALAIDPKILLLDEPLSALDALTRATLQDEIERIWRQERKTVVLITNDVDEGLLLADRIVTMTAGPGATLGREFVVNLERPRDRKALNHDPAFKRLRNEITDHLIAINPNRKKSGQQPCGASTRFFANQAA